MKSLEYRREAARLLLDYACQGAHGRNELDPVYKVITENRDGPTPQLRARYSSCGDLAHWLLFRLGLDPSTPWLNREEETPKPGDWKSGVNLNWLVPPPIGKCAPAKRLLGTPEPGDIIVINNVYGGHVMCVTGLEGDLLHTAEYGQPGGLLKTHTLVEKFRKSVMSHVSLGALTWARDPDVEPLRQWLTGEEFDVLQAIP